MDEAQILALVKERLGIRTAVRDTYLTAIVRSVVQELEDQHKLVLDPNNAYHLMFCVDYSTWRYQSADNSETSFTGQPLSMPRHLQFRLHNLLVHLGGVQT
ncbi:hypothetical protein [Paenibacillus cineris]|uniref:hypothetical protein n=1 Tax=Paenibacillus cineris TaxID=237530 RepID=UPI001B19FC0A|nr:hypothetical protein [Paenibacillus cineris]GIO63575.1 hypothetical protein J43TS9_51490 [Paenibacillus cineris]